MDKITTILNCYRRPKNLEQQIDAIRSQGLSSSIWIWVNGHEDNKSIDFSKYKVDCIIKSSINFKYHGRFTCGLLASTPYLAYFDDDTIPGSHWFENCLSTIELAKSKGYNSPILGSAGVVLHNEKYINHTRVGWPSKNNYPTIVDLVGHAWFFNTSLLKYLWYEEPISLLNGEDIQFSYLVQKYADGGITLCPPHPATDKSFWGSIKAEELGIDDVASSNNKTISHHEFFKQRDNVIEEALKRGWKPIYKQHVQS